MSMGESNTVISAYTLYRHLQQYCSHLLMCSLSKERAIPSSETIQNGFFFSELCPFFYLDFLSSVKHPTAELWHRHTVLLFLLVEKYLQSYDNFRLHLGAEWFSFVDPQSGISHYVWRVGTEKYGDNILVATNVHKQQESFIIDYLELTGNQLPIDGTRLYSTIRAYNRAGESLSLFICSMLTPNLLFFLTVFSRFVLKKKTPIVFERNTSCVTMHAHSLYYVSRIRLI